MPFDEYRKTQSREMSKRLKYSLGELELTVTDERYTVFINPNIFYDDNDIYGRNGSNGFVYLRADSDGCVESRESEAEPPSRTNTAMSRITIPAEAAEETAIIISKQSVPATVGMR